MPLPPPPLPPLYFVVLALLCEVCCCYAFPPLCLPPPISCSIEPLTLRIYPSPLLSSTPPPQYMCYFVFLLMLLFYCMLLCYFEYIHFILFPVYLSNPYIKGTLSSMSHVEMRMETVCLSLGFLYVFFLSHCWEWRDLGVFIYLLSRGYFSLDVCDWEILMIFSFYLFYFKGWLGCPPPPPPV